ncbi:MAG: helix-turn-helix domain-containing protein, partial [Clostridia bacterium]|nr:helix-turn-helix domain-containing protein [Clostridia bacterium]
LFQPDFFRYRVEGSRSWTYESDEPRLSLSALAPGDYTLWVSCRTKGGSFSSPQRMLSLTVLPPWYRTSWFAMVCSLLVAVLLLLTVRYILRRQQSESKNAMGHFLEEMLQEEEPPEEDGDENPLCPDPDFRNKLDKLIMENLSDPDLGIKFLTDRLPLSRSSLYAKVKEVTGMGVKDYINRMRIERSVQLLMTTNKTINEIAYEVGFTYPRYFSTSFKLFKGVTPTTFKKENRHE